MKAFTVGKTIILIIVDERYGRTVSTSPLLVMPIAVVDKILQDYGSKHFRSFLNNFYMYLLSEM